MKYSKIKGSALVTALFIMTLVAIISVAITVRLSFDIARAEIIITEDNLFQAALGAKFWALGVLADPNNTNPDNLAKNFPQSFTAKAINNITVSATLSDAQGKFNINNVIQSIYVPFFVNLITNVSPNISKQQAQKIIQIMQAKIITGKMYANINANIMSDYSIMIPHPFVSVSELRLIPGVTANLYTKLAPYITALPTVTAININSAPLAIIQSLGTGLTQEQAQNILQKRQESQGFSTIVSFLQDESTQSLQIPIQEISTSSNYFQLAINVKNKDQSLAIFDIMQQGFQNGQNAVAIIYESRGTL